MPDSPAQTTLPSTWPAIRGLIFDMDGTLVDNMGVHVEAWEAWHGQNALPFDRASFFASTAGRTNAEIVGALLPHLSAEERAALGAGKDELYRTLYAPRVEAVPGLQALLDEAGAADLAMTVATAAPPANADLVLDGLSIRRHFRAVLSPSMGYRGKPHPDLFLAAAEAMGVEPGACLVFEDAPLGIEAARAAGMRAVGVTTMLSAGELAADNVVLSVATYADPALRALLGL